MLPRSSTLRVVSRGCLALGITTGWFLAPPVSAQCPHLKKIVSSNGTANQQFGRVIVRDGDVVVVGAFKDTTLGTDAGTAYVYRYDATLQDWLEEAQLFASDGASGDLFGRAIDVDGDRIIVGAPRHDLPHGTDCGAAYVYRYKASTAEWVEEQKLIPGAGAASNLLGQAVGIDGDRILVGSPGSDEMIGDAGSVFAFRYKGAILGWLEEQQLFDSNPDRSDLMGYTLVMQGDLAFIGSPFDNTSHGSDAGSVAVFEFDGSLWSNVQQIEGSTTEGQSDFGLSLAFDGTRLVVGAPFDDVAGNRDAGSAFVYEFQNGSWTETAILTEEAIDPGDQFGTSVAVEEDLIAVGAWGDDDVAGGDVGMVHLFRRGGQSWFVDVPMFAGDRATSDLLGSAVVFAEGFVLAGALGDNLTAGKDVGSLYVFTTEELQLNVSNSDPLPGEVFTVEVLCGNPGDSVMLFVAEVNGIPVFVPILLFVFNSDYALTLNLPAPNPGLGVQVGFQAAKFGAKGYVVFSDIEPVDL